MTAATDSREAAILLGLQALLQPLTAMTGTLLQLPPTGADEAWALAWTGGETDVLDRWGQGVLTLEVRAQRGNPLDVHRLARPLVARLASMTATVLPGGVTVNQAEHRGPVTRLDSSGRTVRSDLFPLDLDYQA